MGCLTRYTSVTGYGQAMGPEVFEPLWSVHIVANSFCMGPPAFLARHFSLSRPAFFVADEIDPVRWSLRAFQVRLRIWEWVPSGYRTTGGSVSYRTYDFSTLRQFSRLSARALKIAHGLALGYLSHRVPSSPHALR